MPKAIFSAKSVSQDIVPRIHKLKVSEGRRSGKMHILLGNIIYKYSYHSGTTFGHLFEVCHRVTNDLPFSDQTWLAGKSPQSRLWPVVVTHVAIFSEGGWKLLLR